VGEPPFTGPTAQAVLARHSLDVVSPPSIVRATIPDAAEAAILRALAKLPADRYATTALFVEALTTPSAATGAHRRASRGGAAAPRVPWRRVVPIAACGLIAVVLALVVARRGEKAGSRVAAEGGLDPRHVAVLYFEDQSAGKTLGYGADGLTEALIDALGQVPALSVVSKNGVAPYRTSEVAPDSVARAVNVSTVIRGQVEETGNRYHVSVRLIDGASGADYKRASFDQAAGDLLVIRDSVAQRVAEFLRPGLGDEVRVRMERLGTSSVAAWSLRQRAEKSRKDAETALQG